MVITFTNHALDQFLEDLLDIGIPRDNIVRLGSKGTATTVQMAIRDQEARMKFSQESWFMLKDLGVRSDRYFRTVQTCANEFKWRISHKDILEHLQFDDRRYFDAFTIQGNANGNLVGQDGRRAKPWFLLSQWAAGKGADSYAELASVASAPQIWSMKPDDRRRKLREWEDKVMSERAESLYEAGKDMASCQRDKTRIFAERTITVLQSKRIIGCTTTAAAMYREEIAKASASTVLVEEAGEILESHVSMALGPDTRRLVFIGDHKCVSAYL